MAKINTTSITITLSELVKDGSPDRELLSADTIAQLEQVITQLASESAPGSVLVEVLKAE
jgi:hypothetical protein|tara:strand:- start:61 stop:240 length:180 start_codon:yes stop_codon:yes gene_type:complete